MREFRTKAAIHLLIAAALLAGGCQMQDDAGPPAEAPAAVLSAPVLQLSPGVNEVRVSWSATPEAEGYRLYWQAGAPVEAGSPTVDLDGNTTSYLQTGLQAGVTYHYRVAALQASGEGEWSAEAVAIPASARLMRSDTAP